MDPSPKYYSSDTSSNVTPPYSTALTSAIRLADQITRRHSSSIQWSSWHLWDHLHHHPTPSPQTSIWDTIYPFASCSGFCYLIAKDLSTAYEATADLSHFASQLQILASWEKDPSAPEEDPFPRHCVVALLTAEACVLIDLVYSPIVIVIPAGGMYETIPYITMSGRRGKRVFYYDGHKLEMANPKRDIVIRDPFRPITAMEALCLISAPAAIKTFQGTKIPMTKMIIIRGTVREAPMKVPSTQLDVGEWMITMCRLQVDFQKRQLTMQIPLEDWLLKERNARYHWIQSHEMFRRLDDGVANLVVHVSPDQEDTSTMEKLKILKGMARCLGLPDAEMDRIVESVNEVGQEDQTSVL